MSARSDPGDDLTPKQIADLKRQLKTANARLIAVERERRELKENVATLAALLKRADGQNGG